MPSPRSSKKTEKKRVRHSLAQPQVIEFQRDFSPRNIGNLWASAAERASAIQERRAEMIASSEPDRNHKENKEYRKKIIREMRARKTLNNLIPAVAAARSSAREPSLTRFGIEETEDEVVAPEERIQLQRRASIRDIRPLIAASPRNIRNERVVPVQRGFIFRVYDAAKTLVNRPKRGGVKKTQKRRRR
jgi:hypothetical protein